METYPKSKYHVRGGGSVLVTSPEQEKALGVEWIDVKPVYVQTEAQDTSVTESNESPRPDIKLNEVNRRTGKR